MQNVLIYNLEVACAGTSHLDREVRVGFFFIAYKCVKTFPLTTIHKTENKTLQTKKYKSNKFFCVCFISQPKQYEKYCFVTCLLRSENKVSATRCKSASTLKFLKSRGIMAICYQLSKVFRME